MAEEHFRVEMRLLGGQAAAVEMAVALSVMAGTPPEIEIILRLSLPDRIALRASDLQDKGGLRRIVAELEEFVSGDRETAYLTGLDSDQVELRFEGVAGEAEKAFLSGQCYGLPLDGPFPLEPKVPDLAHLQLDLYGLYFAFQRLVMARSEVRRLTDHLRRFLEEHGDELPPSLESTYKGRGQ
jgi:hypothetical protein